MAAETNVIKKADLARAREVVYAYRFADNIRGLMKVLNITRPIQKQAGTVLKAYKTTGTLENGTVAEGDIIPLSHFQTEVAFTVEVGIKKYRKASTAEAILKGGYDQAVIETNNKAIGEAQKGIKSDFYTYLAEGTGTAEGDTLQALLANANAQLAIAYEDQDYEPVHFVNPEDLAGYLGTAAISLQTAFGLKYISDFLGLGTVIVTASVEKGTTYSTVKENINLYYVNVKESNGLGDVFDFSTDETGLIGIHTDADYTRATAETMILTGCMFFAEMVSGIVVGTLGNS